MVNDIQQNEKAYTTKEIATLLDMAISTVRKYSQHLEKAGYIITKTESKARIFTAYDMMVLRYLKDLRDKTNITVDQATNIVIERFGKEPVQTETTENTAVIMQYEKRCKEMQIKLNEHTELIKLLSARLEETEKQNNVRDDIVIQSLKKLAGMMKLVIKENSEKKSWFSRLLNK